MCEYCKTVGKEIGIIETDDRIFINLSGAYLQIYDEDYPGFSECIKIRYCPMCGRDLDKKENQKNKHSGRGRRGSQNGKYNRFIQSGNRIRG